MKIHVIIITRNKACAVRTLHMLLALNLTCVKFAVQVEFTFMEDKLDDISDTIGKVLKTSDRILYLDYGTASEPASITHLLSPFPQGGNMMVVPVVVPGINWEQFKSKLDSPEPIHQRGLEFDTVVNKKLTDQLWTVKYTDPHIWSLDCKSTLKKLKGEKGKGIKIPIIKKDFIALLKTKGVKILTCPNVESVTQFQHECISNILNASGINAKVPSK